MITIRNAEAVWDVIVSRAKTGRPTTGMVWSTWDDERMDAFFGSMAAYDLDNVIYYTGSDLIRMYEYYDADADELLNYVADEKIRFVDKYNDCVEQSRAAINRQVEQYATMLSSTPSRDGYVRLYRAAWSEYKPMPLTFWANSLRVALGYMNEDYNTIYTINVPIEDLDAAAIDYGCPGDDDIEFDQYIGKADWVNREDYDFVPVSDGAIDRMIDFGTITWKA